MVDDTDYGLGFSLLDIPNMNWLIVQIGRIDFGKVTTPIANIICNKNARAKVFRINQPFIYKKNIIQEYIFGFGF